MRWLALLALLVGACGIAETPPGEPLRPRGADPRISPPQPTGAPADNEAEPAAERSAAPQVQPAEEAAPAPGTPTSPGEGEAEAEAEEPVRDLAVELQSALAGVVGCLGVREANGPDHLSVTVSVTFVASGMATRAEASSADLSETERACVRQRALATRLQGPLEDAPRTVATTITLNRQPSP